MRATTRRAQSEHAWREAIRDAAAAGLPVRSIAPLVGVSHQRVHQIVREQSTPI